MFKFFSKSSKLTAIASTTAFVLICVSASESVNAQIASRGKNNPYSPSPNRTVTAADPASAVPSPTPARNAVSFAPQRSAAVVENRPIVAKTNVNIPKNSATSSKLLTEIYKVGVGDMLFVNLKNSPHGSGYFTVRRDGTIDFPLAGENVRVVDQTTEAIEKLVESGITLYANPHVEVKVRQYMSHRITVSGIVQVPGEKKLQREAMPLFAIRAEAGVGSRASRALITRAPLRKVESYELRDSQTDNVLIYPGNSVEFVADETTIVSKPIENKSETKPIEHKSESYWIARKGVPTVSRPLTAGITFSRAVLASSGPKNEPKKAKLHRKDYRGRHMVTEYDLRKVKARTQMDPILAPGDTIEIDN